MAKYVPGRFDQYRYYWIFTNEMEYGDPSLDNGWVKIYTDPHDFEEPEGHPIHTLLEDNEIPFKIKFSGELKGTFPPRIYYDMWTYVEKEDETRAVQLIAQYNSSQSVLESDIETFDNAVDILPQVKCGYCGEMYDLDYPKCPHCGNKIVCKNCGERYKADRSECPYCERYGPR